MDALPARWADRWGNPAKTMPVAEVERAIAEAGVMGNADFARPAGRSGGGWWTWKPATHALDYLWKSGRIAVHSREHFHKRYALMERVLPQAAAVAPLSPAEVARQRLLRSLAAMGAATDAGPAQATGRGPAGACPEPRATLAALVRSGEVVEAARRGPARPHFAAPADLPALGAGRARTTTLARHHAALPVRLVPVASRTRRAALGLSLPHRDLRSRAQAHARLLLAAAPARGACWWAAWT